MIRRDYIIRMIEECTQLLVRINALKRGQQWNEAATALDDEFQYLAGADATTLARLSETELLARLMRGEPTSVVRHKTFVLSALLQEAGDIAAGRDLQDESRACYLKSLNLLLDTLARGDELEFPEFVPKVESLTAALQESPLPTPTNALLMLHYERIGEFAKADSVLKAMLAAEPQNTRLMEFGMAFCRRLLALNDATLAGGNISRSQLEQFMSQLRAGFDRNLSTQS